jgi:D-beta-D-heptose 7-phosphate kinase/D-beta-D-heptose 1-phosphate adenosyltransferase
MAPNLHEACTIAETEDVSMAGKILVEMSGSPTLITRGAEGMTLFGAGDPCHLDAQAANVVDVSGAGDTVVTTAALALAAGATLFEAITVANAAAAVAVSKPGTATVTQEELLSFL